METRKIFENTVSYITDYYLAIDKKVFSVLMKWQNAQNKYRKPKQGS